MITAYPGQTAGPYRAGPELFILLDAKCSRHRARQLSKSLFVMRHPFTC
jgi:hypothetical protein